MSLYKGYNFYHLSHLFVQKPNLQTRGRKTEVEDIFSSVPEEFYVMRNILLVLFCNTKVAKKEELQLYK
jgi:hypothetical protein